MSNTITSETVPDALGHFGPFGGRFVPETLVPALDELEQEFEKSLKDPDFQTELQDYLLNFAGRPTPLTFARRMMDDLGGARIYLKREDLLHTGAHKINNSLGQALLTTRMGKKRVVAETGAGQHGVATATVCALFGLECIIYMGTEDMERQSLNVFRMEQLGAEVVPVDAGSRTLKDAINEAMLDWVTNVGDTYYLLGSVLGPHPYPLMVREFQSVIGREARVQFLDLAGRPARGAILPETHDGIPCVRVAGPEVLFMLRRHDDDGEGILEDVPGDSAGAVVSQVDAFFSDGLDRIGIGGVILDAQRAGRGGLQVEALFFYAGAEHRLRHRGAADVPAADEDNPFSPAHVFDARITPGG